MKTTAVSSQDVDHNTIIKPDDTASPPTTISTVWTTNSSPSMRSLGVSWRTTDDDENEHDTNHNNNTLLSTTNRSEVTIHTNASSSGTSVQAKSLHSNLMRSCQHRDPYSIYEVIQVLGEGSMGSVSKVRKRDSAVGGSARREFVKRHSRHYDNHNHNNYNKNNPCFGLVKLFQNILPTAKPTALVVPAEDALVTSELTTTTCNFPSWRSLRSSIRLLGSSSAPSSPESNSQFQQQQSTSTNNNNPKQFFRKQSSMVDHTRKPNAGDHYYALKSIHLDRCESDVFQQELLNEITILRELDHANICKAVETYEYQGRIYVCLELCHGGDLYTRDPYTEGHAHHILASLLSAMAYLHAKGIVHRDLKFENIMFVNTSPDAEVKLIDFGLSKKYAANEHLHDTVGTIYTMSPELLAGDYGSKSDIWSIGVIAFMLLSSSMPFYGNDRVKVIKRIVKGRPKFTSARWGIVSEDAKAFVQTLLKVDPEARPTAERALKLLHMWGQNQNFHNRYTERHSNDLEMMDKITTSIQSFSQYGTLKKLALMVVAYKSTEAEVGYLRRVFKRFDILQNGEISKDEFFEALMDTYDYTPKEVEALFNGIDVDGTGSVHYSEFLASTIEAHGVINEERLAEAFDRIDSDDSGYISIKNLRDFLGEDVPVDHLERIIDEADLLRDKQISYDEFLELWNEESDQVMEAVKADVQKRRMRRYLSTASSIDTFETQSTTSSPQGKHGGEDEKVEITMPLEQETEDVCKTPKIGSCSRQLPTDNGTNFFESQKFLSIRSLGV